MKISRTIIEAALLALLGINPALAEHEPAAVAKTNPTKVYMHYMPWFETPETLGGNTWGWHWRMNNRNPNIVDATGKRQIASHYYPKIGPYASRDPHVIEYHMLLMKLSGVDGVLIDWYGVSGTNGDINDLLVSSNALVNKVDDFGLDFGVVLEDRFSSSTQDAKNNVAYLRNNYFNRPEYIRLGANQNPLLMVFGPITFQQPSQWTQILAEAGEDVDFLTLWYESAEAGANAAGEYPWIYEEAALNNHFAHQSNFYKFRTPNLSMAAGVAYPGFEDFYVEGGVGNVVPFDIPHDDGQTLDSLLNLVGQHASSIDFLQLATFNDFGEGTMFEPTIETGYDYLKQVQQFTGVSYGEAELELVYRLFLARKKYANQAAIDAQLEEVSQLLSALQVAEAEELLNATAPAGDYDGDGDVDGADYNVWRSAYGSQTVLHGSGADGNFDGFIDAADYTVWRNSMGVGEGGSGGLSNTVPEPSALSLAMLTLAVVIGRWPGRTRAGA